MTGPSLDDLKRAVKLTDMLERDGVRLSGQSSTRHRRGCCPIHGGDNPSSFAVDTRKQTFVCHSCDAAGSVVDYIMGRRGVDICDARRILIEMAGGAWSAPPAPRKQQRSHAAERRRADWVIKAKRDEARALWRAASPIEGTPSEAYLLARGLTRPPVGWSAMLRHHPACAYRSDGGVILGTYPAMLGLLTEWDVDRGRWRLCAIHRTYLDPVRPAKLDLGPGNPAKKLLAPPGHGAIRLEPADDRVLIAEGVESALACAGAGCPVWGAYSINQICGARATDGELSEPDMDRPALILPPSIRRVVIVRDADSEVTPRKPGSLSNQEVVDAKLERARRRWTREGRRVAVISPPAGMDILDFANAVSANANG